MTFNSLDLRPVERAELAATLIGAPDAVWERAADGVSTIVYRIAHGEQRYYLRILPEEGATFAPEAEAHRKALALGCRAPEIMSYEAANEVIGRSLMLTREIPGRPLVASDDPEVIRHAVQEAGRDLARINSIAVEGFGWVRRDWSVEDGTLAAAHRTLEAALDAEYLQALGSLPEEAVPGVPDSEIRQSVGRAIELVRTQADSRLAHGDFDTSHIFIDEGRYAGIIDFGEIRGMPPLYDLGHHRMHDRERLPCSTLDWLVEGYREITPISDDASTQIAAWSLLIAVRALARGFQRDPAGPIVTAARRVIWRDLAVTGT